MQYSSIMQLINTTIFCVFSITSKFELLYYNWGVGSLYYDHPDINTTLSSWIHYFNPTLFNLGCLPIYIAGTLQILALDAIMDEKGSVIRSWVIKRPFAFFSLGIIPGFIAVILYWIEMSARGIDHPYSVNGQIIAPYNLSYVIITTYILSICSTIYGLIITLRTWGKLKTNFKMMIEIAQKRVLQIGYTMPIIGFIKGFELLIWIFPSVINVYYGTYGMVIAALPPILSFFNNGSNKNIYPLVPFFSKTLGAIYTKSSTEKAWNPFYSESSKGISHLVTETNDGAIPAKSETIGKSGGTIIANKP
ncbi:hypothetical protein HDV06_005337 [Boothiomyces sp. JEL0866]|nr:hypothetical protein HDV06_005337 [Boothiomyces sp. JEL0866]